MDKEKQCPIKSEQGQISILLGMIMLTFLLFFTFVVNTGMLVNAKINLQNAADLVAYSGAAVQARQLNQISFLNYQMRREYKKFLFRYYVIGNMAQKTQPQSAVGGTRIWSPDGNPANNYNVPAVCVNFQPNDNYCQIAALPGTVVPTPSPLDATSTVLFNALNDIEQIRQNGCFSIGKTNLQLLHYWLFNTDPGLSEVENALPPSGASSPGDLDPRKVLQTLRSLAYGIGLVPREIILRSRIKTLTEYVNHKPEVMTVTLANTMRNPSTTDWPPTERSVQAFLSAFHTLGNNIFDNADPDNIVMTELLPGDTDNATLLDIPFAQDTKAEFDAYAVDFDLVDKVPPQAVSKDCVAKLVPVTLKNAGVPVAVHKNPAVLTYYAIRLEAKAKVMFSPWGDMSLKAYSAAQPFGSRIGPAWAWPGNLKYTKPGTPNPSLPQCPAGSCVGAIPYLDVMNGKGWDDNDVIFKMFEGFAPQVTGPSGNNVPSSLSIQDMQRAYHVAMSPNDVL